MKIYRPTEEQAFDNLLRESRERAMSLGLRHTDALTTDELSRLIAAKQAVEEVERDGTRE